MYYASASTHPIHLTMRLFLLCLLLGSGFLMAQPGNDSCHTATFLSNIDQLQSLSVDLTAATESMDAGCEVVTNTNLDVWYSFTMPFDGQVQVSGINPAASIALFDGCGGTTLYCLLNNGFFQGLHNGTTYYFRYGSPSNQLLTDNFSLQAFPPPANDSCIQAQLVNNIDLAQALSVDLRGAVKTASASCETASSDYLDMWFQFTMPFDGKIHFTGVNILSVISIYDGCEGTELSCDLADGFSGPLTNGTTYWFRYAAPTFYLLTDNFTVQAFAPPTNDSCSNAILLSNIDLAQNLSIDLRGASGTATSSCDAPSSSYFDVWYSFTMPFDGNIRFTSVNTLAILSIHDACGGSEVDCELDNGFSAMLSGGTTYHLRYAARTNLLLTDAFTLQAFAPPVNDSCPDALPILNLATEQSISVDLRGASETLDSSCETASNDNLDMWFNFTMPFDGRIQFSGVNTFATLTLYDTCGGSEVDCEVNSGFTILLTGGQDYWLRYAANSYFLLTDVFNMQAFAPPANDSCQDAILLTNLDQPQDVSLDLRGAAETDDASCENSNLENLDLWYRFTLPYDARIRFTNVNSISTLTLYDTCGGNEVDCILDNGFTSALTGGEDYWVRYAVSSGLLLTDIFTLQAFTVPPNDSCQQAQVISNIDLLQSVPYDMRGGTEDLDASCDDPAKENLDVWFSLTMQFTGRLQLSQLTIVDHVSLYQACGGPELDCQIGNGFFDSLQSGNTYLLRLSNTVDFAAPGTLGLQAFIRPENDECFTPDTLFQTGTNESLSFETRGAYEHQDVSCENATDENLDLWFTFTMPVFGELNITGAESFYRFSLFDSCGSTEISCLQGNGNLAGLTAGTDYLLRFGVPATFAGEESFDISATSPLALPPDVPASETRSPDSEIVLYPMPVDDWLQVQGIDLKDCQIDLYDMNGRRLGPVITRGQQIDLHPFSAGMYLCRIWGPGHSSMHKIVIK